MTHRHTLIDNIAFLDDATRPRAPALSGVTPEQRDAGQHLVEIHDHLRDNMRTLRTLIERAATGAADPASIAGEAGALALVGNFRRFGNLCGQYCRFVHGHHSLEDAAVFPALARQGEAWRQVSDRLAAEHVVIHELLVRLIGALEALATEPTPEHFADARFLYETLERELVSHLGYEEDEIADALGYFGLV